MHPYLLYVQQISRAQEESPEQLGRRQALRDLELQARDRRAQRTRGLARLALTLVRRHRTASALT
jgi:hypothetical protein